MAVWDRLLAGAELSAEAQASAASAQPASQVVLQQAAWLPSPQTLAAQVLQLADSAPPTTCSLWSQRGTCTMPLRISVGGAAGPASVLSSIAYTKTLPV